MLIGLASCWAETRDDEASRTRRVITSDLTPMVGNLLWGPMKQIQCLIHGNGELADVCLERFYDCGFA